MRIPISWIKDYADIDLSSPQCLKNYAEKMTMSGSKVEKIHHLGADISGVVVGRIEEIFRHPNADTLFITKVDIGDGTIRQIVTGADNLKQGDYIPVALHGAQLANGLAIKKTKMRGEVSEGMLVSIEEVGYTRAEYPEAPEGGIYVFDRPHELGIDARPILGILDDVVEFELTSNRPDCFSVVGMARETSATYNAGAHLAVKPLLARPLSDDNGSKNISEYIDVEIANPKLCPRYIAAVVKNVKIEPSPQWLRRRLIACGLRPINNIVDITNYVMLEYGQPMHAFDIRAIGGGKIIVRNAYSNEKLTTLDGIERNLDEDMLVIADENKAVGIAGIMGGEFSKILDDTTTILFESASFYGPNIRLSSKKLGLRTDSSGRYEKGLDPNLAFVCINRALELIKELNCGDVVPGLADRYPNPRSERQLEFDPAKIAALLGIEITFSEIVEILSRVGIAVDGNTEGKSTATVPTHRYDIETWEDLAEEAARLYGYDKIPTVMASSSNVGRKNKNQQTEETLINTMVALGYSQILTFAFESPKSFDKLLIPEDSFLRDTVNIINPLGEDSSIMRTMPVNSMLTALSTNYNRRNQEAAFFELVKIYRPNASANQPPVEKEVLVAGGYGDMDFYHAKGVLETVIKVFGLKGVSFVPIKNKPFMHPGRTAALMLEGVGIIGVCGQVHPQVLENYEIGVPAFLVLLHFDDLLKNADLTKTHKAIPRYPQIQRDIALVVKMDVLHGELEAKIKEAGGKYLRSVQLFDIYTGEGLSKGLSEDSKSMAYNLTFRADDRTLTDNDASKAITKILKATEEAFGAQLRG